MLDIGRVVNISSVINLPITRFCVGFLQVKTLQAVMTILYISFCFN